ncbi:MAG: hydroxymethylglutaryl-CoA lyase [Polynucleobacter sp.]|jgi:hydroxymethylglutaryl-CoA lyase|uniref:hydroxymethylglutaryl-CoA lyase n=1 Tax=Polynucleobacter sp. 31A-FELB TaxID=2689096 RepID=UPI001B78D52F|nr:hydroxymethylglutaryl-CoA lyase [Polynucleobacter sp. 31A-FELB]MBP7942893.1 hydroxymethylglutaryl-CoA lyase [Polynucleobacter sp.]MBU3587214.1 hydroxymethylglutaryl-CoA lyase [Polynucleobacter sp. 31A-FELB]
MNHSTTLPKKVKIVEVGPRDGLQNEKQFVENQIKIHLINQLSAAGFANIEAAAFVSPKWVPQMAGSDVVMQGIERKPNTIYSVLVPNMQGLEKALAAKADEIVIFGAASEAFSQKNINCSIEESIARFIPVVNAAKEAGVRTRASVSCALGCPYEGDIDPAKVANVVQRMADLGCDEIDIADTIGVGTPGKVKAVFERVSQIFPIARLSGHFHDTYGQSLANIYAALEVGVSTFHSSVAGLGGCPYAKGATGNVATEDVLYLLRGLGIETNVDFEAVARIGGQISKLINRPNGSRAGRAYLAKLGE